MPKGQAGASTTKSKGRPKTEKCLSEKEIALRDLEVEIDRINAAMQEMSDKRRSLQTQRNSKLSFFNLAPEICIAIFSFACHKGRLPLRNRQLVMTPPSSAVFVVPGGTWRVERSAPELWSSVSLCIDPFTEGSAIQAELLDQWLRLAQGPTLPLSIIITFNEQEVHKWNRDYGGYMPIPEDGVIFVTRLPTDVISVAASYSRQWEALDIFLASAWAETLDSTIGRILNLILLSLQFVPYNYGSYLSFTKTFLDAPKLRTVALDFESMDVGLPYRQLEKLTLWSFKTTPCLAVLEKCSSLTFCRIIERWKAEHLSHLELRLDGVDQNSARPRGLFRKFFDYLRSPNTTSGAFLLPYLKSLKYHRRIYFESDDNLSSEEEENVGFDIRGALEKTLLARWNAQPSSNGVSQLQTFCMSVASRWSGSSKVVVDRMKRSLVVKELALIKEGMDLLFESVLEPAIII